MADEAVVAVVFSALAVEAFLNDVVHLTEEVTDSVDWGSTPDVGEKFKVFGYIMKELEDRNSSIAIKMQMAHLFFTGTHLDSGSQPYQNYKILTNLRNALVHSKPVKHGVSLDDSNQYEPQKIVKQLVDQKVIPKPSPQEPPALMPYIRKPEVARWAYGVAVEMRTFLVQLIPEGEIKNLLLQVVKGADDRSSL